jgi:prepilin-type N-terminal cleavage/methylation domain-containing protein
MKCRYLELNRGQAGFTLVELLIVIAIIGVLSAIIIPNVTGLTSSGQEEASSAELVTLQTAMDAMMVKNNLSSVTVVKTATKDMAAFPDKNHPLYPNFLRLSTTNGTYICDSTGQVSRSQGGNTPTIKPTVTKTIGPTATVRPSATLEASPLSERTIIPED